MVLLVRLLHISPILPLAVNQPINSCFRHLLIEHESGTKLNF